MRPLAALSTLLLLAASRLVWADPLVAAAPATAQNPARPETNPAQTPKASGAAASASSKEGEAAAWREACDENSPEAYANFLYLYPDGQHTKEAFCRLARVADPVVGRVTDVPFFGATGPFRLDAFFALDAQRHGKPTNVTDALVHSSRGKSLLSPLIAVAQSEEPVTRLAAVDLLFALDDLWWLATLPPQDRSRLDGAIVPGLQSLLPEKSSSAAAGAADLLWQIRRERHAAPLLAALKPGGVPALRRAAADVLGLVGGATAVEPLAAVLKQDEDSLARLAAAESLGEIGDARAVPALATAIAGDKQLEVRLAAAVALRMLGVPEAAEPLAGAVARDKSPIVRWVAVCALGTLGDDRAVAPLVTALRDEDRSVRGAAAETLGALRDPRAVEPLLALLKTEKISALRSASIDALGVLGDAHAVAPLVDVIRQQRFSGDQPTSTSAALALRAIGEPHAVQLLFAAVDDRDPQVRSSAAFALGILDASPKILVTLAKQHRHRWYRQQGAWPDKRLFDPRSVHRLIEALAEENAELRQNAALALGMIADARALEPLVALLKQDRQVRVRQAAVRALRMIEDPRTLAPLLEALRDASPSVALRAVEAVRDVKDPRVVDALIESLKREAPRAAPGLPASASPEDPLATEEAVRKAVLRALATAGVPALEPLAASLSHHSPQVRESAALALGILRDPRAVPPLLAALKDESSWVREKAAAALGMIGDPRAADPLMAMLKDQAPETRDAALRALGLLGTPRQSSSISERLRASTNGARYRINYWITLLSLGWRPQSPEDCVRLLAAQDQRVMLLAIWPFAKKVLLTDAAAGDDAATVQRIAELLIALGREECVADLLALLKAKGSKSLAAAYFHSGRMELQEAATRWAQDRGRIQFPARQPGRDVQWGSL